MSKYAITFSKKGYIKYTSHLDMLRLFKRAVKKANIKLCYSQGFNPHPKMGFAQPLSLGYESNCEIVEIETLNNMDSKDIICGLQCAMPNGIEILECVKLKDELKSISSLVTEAEYLIEFPIERNQQDFGEKILMYLAQEQILAEKKQKKTKKHIKVNIKEKIKSMTITENDNLTLKIKVNCGSKSNLSPEQVISTFVEFSNIDVERYDIDVKRIKFLFGNNLQI